MTNPPLPMYDCYQNDLLDENCELGSISEVVKFLTSGHEYKKLTLHLIHTKM